ncbi:hypothetical protein V8E55_003933 [Tylopilus felleus]
MAALTSSQIAGDVRLVRAITFSRYSLLVWDYLLTLDDEVFTPLCTTHDLSYPQRVHRWVVKYLFIGNRYVNLLVQPVTISQVTGVLLLHSSAACLAFVSAVASASRNRKITIALMAMLILYFSTCIAALAYMLSEIRYERRCAAKIVCFLSEWLATLCTNTPAEIISISQWLIWNVEMFHIAALRAHSNPLLGEHTCLDRVKLLIQHESAGSPITLINITGQRLAIDLRHPKGRHPVAEVEMELAAYDNHPVVPHGAQ